MKLQRDGKLNLLHEPTKLRIGSRGSHLARWQTDQISALVCAAHNHDWARNAKTKNGTHFFML
jgi:hypothetical protein